MIFDRLKKNNEKGFTLIELLVVTFIVALLAALTLVNYRSGEKKYALSQAVQKLVSDLRQAQTRAMSGVDITGQYCGYGIYAEKNNRFYLIYGDQALNCESSNNKYDAGDTVIETVNLPERIEISAVSPLSNKIDVFFKPPEPTTYLNSDASGGISGTITLKVEGTSLTGTVTVTTAGLIRAN